MRNANWHQRHIIHRVEPTASFRRQNADDAKRLVAHTDVLSNHLPLAKQIIRQRVAQHNDCRCALDIILAKKTTARYSQTLQRFVCWRRTEHGRILVSGGAQRPGRWR